MPSGSTMSSTGTRASSGRSSRDARRRSSITVRETAGTESASSTSGADERHGEPEPERALVEPGREHDAGKLLAVEPSGERGEPEPEQQPEG